MKHIKLFENYKINEYFTPALIPGMIKSNTVGGWIGEELNESHDCVALADVDGRYDGDDSEELITEYNNWYELLIQYNHRGEFDDVLRKIEENKADMWRTDLEETFPCVIINNVDVVGHEMTYNGWFEDLVAVANQ